jgi:hypothetical protein
MELEYVPMLKIQRELYDLPRNMERFRAYLRTMTDPATGDLALPLVAMNPMGKEHVPALLERWLELQAEDAGEAAVAVARDHLQDEHGRFKVGLVLADDAHGGWTNRYAYEFSHRFEEFALYKRGWIVGILWTSEAPAESIVREEVATAIYRAAYMQRHGDARTLSNKLVQEGTAMARAGCLAPVLDADDLTYTRDVLHPLLDSTDRATAMACLFGDDAAHALGYRAHGLSHRAGLALALSDARSERPQTPSTDVAKVTS